MRYAFCIQPPTTPHPDSHPTRVSFKLVKLLSNPPTNLPTEPQLTCSFPTDDIDFSSETFTFGGEVMEANIYPELNSRCHGNTEGGLIQTQKPEPSSFLIAP